ncbi:hypothetical protein LRR81_13525 [Metabacillus sp. GX 13764]|uniref:hypothetical protein n=1 Tax=Metabacillus kandeliae TaxID=2900151 RepID=UPI001E344A1C|nr:hypothetical protein [Metabacillus kandeliae]MCD7035262.1 hypothetical protein [Metabacillus kandeliae]
MNKVFNYAAVILVAALVYLTTIFPNSIFVVLLMLVTFLYFFLTSFYIFKHGDKTVAVLVCLLSIGIGVGACMLFNLFFLS